MKPVAWLLRRKSGGYIRGFRDEPPGALRLQVAEYDKDEWVPVFTEAQITASLTRVEKENNTLRGLLGNSSKPCPYCGLAAEDQAKCIRGFPGCARADDQQLSKHFADAYYLEMSEKELTQTKGKLARKQAVIDELCAVQDEVEASGNNLVVHHQHRDLAWTAARAERTNDCDGEYTIHSGKD